MAGSPPEPHGPRPAQSGTGGAPPQLGDRLILPFPLPTSWLEAAIDLSVGGYPEARAGVQAYLDEAAKTPLGALDPRDALTLHAALSAPASMDRLVDRIGRIAAALRAGERDAVAVLLAVHTAHLADRDVRLLRRAA